MMRISLRNLRRKATEELLKQAWEVTSDGVVIALICPVPDLGTLTDGMTTPAIHVVSNPPTETVTNKFEQRFGPMIQAAPKGFELPFSKEKQAKGFNA